MVVVHVIEPFATGLNTFLQELVFSMPNFEHIIIHGERKDTREIDEIKKEYRGKVKFIKWENAQREIKPFRDLIAYFELRKILKNISYDILHLHSSKAGVLGQMLAKKHHKKIVYTPNAASFLRTDISTKKISIYIWIEKFVNRISKAQIISSSNSEKKEYNKIGIKTALIPNGVTIRESFRTNQVNDKVFKIVFCGKITIQKNPNFFKEISLHYKDNPMVSFTWIGDGEMRDELQTDAITITGWKSKKELYTILDDSDIYLSTSSWEGLSLATIEAASFSLPLLLTECVGNIDMVQNGENGFLFQTKETAIERIDFFRENKKELEQISKKSKDIYDTKYGNYRCGLEYKKLYEEVKLKLN